MKAAKILQLFTRGDHAHAHDPTCEFGITSPHLDKLRELTHKLKGVPASDISLPGPDAASYSMQTDRGEAQRVKIFPMYFDGLIRVERAVIPKGHRLKAHYHEGEIQHISVVRGSASVKMCPPGGKAKIYTIPSGRSIYIPAMTPHNFQAQSDCYIVNVFMPDPNHGTGMLSMSANVVESEIPDEWSDMQPRKGDTED